MAAPTNSGTAAYCTPKTKAQPEPLFENKAEGVFAFTLFINVPGFSAVTDYDDDSEALGLG